MHQLSSYKTHTYLRKIYPQLNKFGAIATFMEKKTNARGVGILLNNNFEYEITECHQDTNGNIIQLFIKCSSAKINLINIYAPQSG